MKKTISAILMLVVGVLVYLNEQGVLPGAPADGGGNSGPAISTSADGTREIAEAYRAQRSDVQVRGEGVVKKILRDDLKGSRHQRFLLRLSNNQTLLVAHNIDLAPRIDDLREGDRVAFYGEYEWNNQGGVLHWTHHDPGGRHADGWLKHQGRTYQ
jgi:molybdopterin converting factor small subunit